MLIISSRSKKKSHSSSGIWKKMKDVKILKRQCNCLKVDNFLLIFAMYLFCAGLNLGETLGLAA